MVHRITAATRKFRTVGRLMMHHAKTHRVSPGRQLVEMLYLSAHNGIGPLEYYLLGLFRPGIPWREKRNMVSAGRYWKMVQRIHPPDIRVLATNKVASNLLMREAGIPTPRFHGVFDRERGTTFDGAPLRDAADLEELINDRSLPGACFKPIDAWSGSGVMKVAFPRSAGGVRAWIEPSGPTLTLGEFCDTYLTAPGRGGYLIQDILEQHPEVARLHPESLNTARTWMHQPEPGRWEMYCANLRMGVDDMTIDNCSAGGIAARIDVESGRLGWAFVRGNDPDGVMLQEHAAHPTTGARIDGETLPMWEEAVALCRRVAEVFPFTFIAADVAMGTEQPWIVEVEADPHSFIQLYCMQGLLPLLEPILPDGE